MVVGSFVGKVGVAKQIVEVDEEDRLRTTSELGHRFVEEIDDGRDRAPVQGLVSVLERARWKVGEAGREPVRAKELDDANATNQRGRGVDEALGDRLGEPLLA